MAKIKIKFGENEVEIDSRDFYVDNDSVGEVINRLTQHLQENKPVISFDDKPAITEKTSEDYSPNFDSLNVFEDAEVHEPEFSEPQTITPTEIRNKLKFLASKSFFDSPRTVSETVEQLREYGWATSPLDVSMVLAKMAFNKEILKNSQENRSYYFLKEALLTN